MQMTKSSLAIILSKLRAFETPKFADEQYTTDSEIAATILWNAFMQENVKNRTIADLGAGTGIFGIGCCLLGAKKAYFVEKDANAVEIMKENLQKMKKMIENCKTEIIFGDVKNFGTKVDAVFQNPPFGVKKLHADRAFLEKAFETAPLIYSLHKSESANFLEKFADEHSFALKGRQEFAFPLKQTMEYHKARIKRINVSCFIFEKIQQ